MLRRYSIVKSSSPARLRVLLSLALIASLASGGCFEKEKGEPYYGETHVPRAQEFRWSNGGLPRVFDPALAAAPPDTDAVRAMFEGLTDYDPRSLAPVSAVATRWEASPDARQWTFHLRRDARWSNGDPVTAKDFVRSWQRTLRLGDRAPHARLLENIEGAQSAVALVTDPSQASHASEIEEETPHEATRQTDTATERETATPAPSNDTNATARNATTPARPPAVASPPIPPVFGARAVGDYVLKVRLRRPDKNFPALVAHPVFRPVYAVSAEEEATDDPDAPSKQAEARAIVSNGAFRLSERAGDSVILERASNYWDASKVALERVRFIAAGDAESALNAYRRGEVDAVTNAPFEPLALKLLAPYEDFRRVTYGALTYYSFNLKHAPFDDRRVREALAIALDRDRLSADTMKGATEPAKKFLPALPDAQGEQPDAPTGVAPQPSPDSDAGTKDTTGVAPDKQAATTEQERTDAGDETPTRTENTSRAEAARAEASRENPARDEAVREGAARDEAARDESNGGGSVGAEQGEKAEGSGAERVVEGRIAPLEQDVERARRLLAEAGFPGGVGFPRIRLLVNRNEQHRVMAQAVAAMWRNVLGVETEIVLRDWEEYEAALWTGDYDIARRGVVMQTTDEESNMLSIFAREQEAQAAGLPPAEETPRPDGSPTPDAEATAGGTTRASAPVAERLPAPVLTEAQALAELPAFPVYFASSYALVKPYVAGFETNLLDAPSLKHVRINTDWKPPQETGVIRVLGSE